MIETCKLCGCQLEYMDCGQTNWDTDKAPYGFPICFDCLKELKEHLKKV